MSYTFFRAPRREVGGYTESLQSNLAWFPMVLGGGDTLNCRPPDQGNLTIGEILIPINQGESFDSTSMDRKPGQCFPKASAIPSMLV